MKKRNFWLTGIVLAVVASTALLLGCPTDTEDDPNTGISPGLYVGGVLTNVSALTGGNLLEKSLTWLKTNAVDGGEYKIALGEDVIVTPVNVLEPTYNPRSSEIGIVLEARTLNDAIGTTVTLTSATGSIKKIKLGNKGFLLQVGQRHPSATGDIPDGVAPITVVLENITLQGLTSGTDGATLDNDQPLIHIGGLGARVIMKKGSKVTGNHTVKSGEVRGAGFQIKRGELIMEDGSIDNMIGETTGTSGTQVLGGAICVVDYNEGGFVMEGGIITNNIAKAVGTCDARGAGVFASRGGGAVATGTSFKMTGGTITRNHTQTVGGRAQGGAFSSWTDPRIELLGGTIKGNTASSETNFSFPGLRAEGDQLTLGGKIEIEDPIVVFGPLTPIKLVSNFNPVGQIPIDFYAAAPSATDFDNKVLLQWADAGKTSAFPVAKFKLGNYATKTGVTATNPLVSITGTINSTTGVFTP